MASFESRVERIVMQLLSTHVTDSEEPDLSNYAKLADLRKFTSKLNLLERKFSAAVMRINEEKEEKEEEPIEVPTITPMQQPILSKPVLLNRLKQLSDSINTVSQQISDNSSLIEGIDGDIVNIDNSINTINNDINLINQRVTINEGDIVNVEGDVVNHDNSINTINNEITVIDDRLVVTEEYQTTSSEDISQLQEDVGTLQQRAEECDCIEPGAFDRLQRKYKEAIKMMNLATLRGCL